MHFAKAVWLWWQTFQGRGEMNFNLLIQRDTGRPSILRSVHTNTPNTGIILMFISESYYVTLMLSGAKYFSALDATSGYWQLKLDEESSLLTTFKTSFGRYRLTRMPLRIHSSQEVFQRTMDMACEGSDGCKSIIDDMLVWGSSKKTTTTI